MRMTLSETKTTDTASVNNLDDIASLLYEDALQEDEVQEDNEAEDEQESDEAEGQSEDSNDSEVDESEQEEQDLTWSKALGIDDSHIVTDEEGNFAGINVKVDGAVSTVDLKTLVDGFQFNKSNTQKAQAIAEERKQIEQFKATAVQEYSTKLENAEKLITYMNSQMLKDFESVDWQTLRVTNPGEYAATYEDFKIRQAEINKIFSAVTTEKQELIQQTDEQLQRARQAHFEQQAEIILQKNPEWSNAEKFKSTMSEFSNFVNDVYGFSPDEFASIADARVIEVIKDAYKYRKGTEVASKKLEAKLPKFQKTSSKPAKKATKLDALIKTAKSAKGYNKKQLQDNAITELLAGVL
jgi:hypothetical protein